MDRDPGRPLEVAVVRDRDLEARELVLFDHLQREGGIRARAHGHRPRTPYGLAGLDLDVSWLHSASELVDRLPGGQTARARLERATGWDLARSWRFDRSIGPGIDVVNTRETFAPTTVQACAYKARYPAARVVVWVFENVPFRFDEVPALRRAKATAFRQADLFVAHSPGAVDALVDEGAPEGRVRLVPLAVDTARFSPAPAPLPVRAAWGVGPEDRVVLFAGRLIREKGVVELVRALRSHLGPGPAGTTRLVVQGSGGDRERVNAAVAALGLRRWVHVVPWAERTSMPDVYRAADVVVLPSLTTPYWEEQFGFNLVEALACGRAVVSTGSGAIPWVLGDAGVVVPPYDVGALGRAVVRVLDDDGLRRDLGARARATAERRFSFEAVGPQHLAAFHEAAQLPPRSP